MIGKDTGYAIRSILSKLRLLPRRVIVLLVTCLVLTAGNLVLYCSIPIEPGKQPMVISHDKHPAVSSDGSRVIYFSPGMNSQRMGLYMIDSAGISLDFFIPFGYDPCWGPGDTILVYTNLLDKHLRFYNMNTHVETVLSDTTQDWRPDYDSGRRLLVFDRYNMREPGNNELLTYDFQTQGLSWVIRGISPSWEKGRQRLAFRWYLLRGKTYEERLFILSTSTGRLDTLPALGNVEGPVFSKSGERLFYPRQEEGVIYPDIYAFDLSSRSSQKLIARADYPAISLAENVLYYAAPDSKNIERIWKMNLDTRATRQLTR